MEQNAELITPTRLLITSTFDRKDYFLYANDIKWTHFLQVSQSRNETTRSVEGKNLNKNVVLLFNRWKIDLEFEITKACILMTHPPASCEVNSTLTNYGNAWAALHQTVRRLVSSMRRSCGGGPYIYRTHTHYQAHYQIVKDEPLLLDGNAAPLDGSLAIR